VLAALLLGFQGCPSPGTLRFSDVTLEAGLDYSHGYTGPTPEHAVVAGGAAAGDFDGDGYVDLYVVRGTLGPNLLFRNQGDGTFQEVGESAGVAVAGSHGSGPLFADLDGDGRLDLFVGAVEGDPIHVFRNRGDGGFDDVTLASGIDPPGPTISAAAADVDRDGDLDLFLTHWNWELPAGPTGHLWQNDGGGVFHDVSVQAGITAVLPVPTPFVPDNPLDLSFTPNFVDVDDDGWPDLLLTSDFRTSQLLRNSGDGSFEDATPDVVSDENGMGAAIGDYDGDLDLDWFVTSIYDPDIPPDVNWGGSGNRLYRNEGQGVFSDVTDAAGVREGFWGWGTCFADFDNDADLDLFHVNGWPGDARFAQDPSRLFLSNGDGTFTERSAELGLVDTGDGRGVVCFDYDRDGDLDIFVANNRQPPTLFRNDLPRVHRSLTLRLLGPEGNPQGIGARIYLTSDGFVSPGERGLARRRHVQVRAIRAGSNYVSQDPAEAHFGLGRAARVSRIDVHWPDGAVSSHRQRARRTTLVHPSMEGLPSVTPGGS
jgi:hypothetical protein